MKLFLISQNVNNGYDTYDSAVVAAETPKQAARIHPGDIDYSYVEGSGWFYENVYGERHKAYGDWAGYADDVFVEYLGEAEEGTPVGIICASFNAG